MGSEGELAGRAGSMSPTVAIQGNSGKDAQMKTHECDSLRKQCRDAGYRVQWWTDGKRYSANKEQLRKWLEAAKGKAAPAACTVLADFVPPAARSARKR